MLNKIFSNREYPEKKIIKIFGIKIILKSKKNKIYAQNKKWYKDNWGNIPHEYVEQYQKLITNLDDESCFIVSTILKRMRKLKRKSFKYEFDFTRYEKDRFLEINENLKDQIIYLGNKIWAYKNFLLYEGMFEPGIFYYDCYTKYLNNLEKVSDKDIIDAGAYIGDSALVLSKLTSKKVYAFEPVRNTFEVMKSVLKLNKTPNIVPVNLGLGAKKETLPLTSKKSMDASFLNQTEFDIQTNITTIDDFVNENNLNIGLIKVDIEGFEQQLLKGAYNTIKKYKPVLLISIYHNPADFFEIKPLIESWNLGYKFKIRKAVDNDVVRDTMLICEL